jgi:hypothetical protein
MVLTTIIQRLVNNDPTLTTLYISRKNIGTKGTRCIADALADALAINKTLTTLNIWNNNIGATGAKCIADALIVNTTITTLDIGSYQEEIKWITTRNKSNKLNKEVSLVDLLYKSL